MGILLPLIPYAREIDTFNGDAWVGLVPCPLRGCFRCPVPRPRDPPGAVYNTDERGAPRSTPEAPREFRVQQQRDLSGCVADQL